MFKLFDFECSKCHAKNEHMLQAPSPKTMRVRCDVCGCDCRHDRVMSLVAPYTGEKHHNPIVMGGNFDTAGMKALPDLPELPNNATREQCNDHFSKPEYKEIERQRKVIAKENSAKKKRLAAIKRGENVSIRRNRLPGDPKNA